MSTPKLPPRPRLTRRRFLASALGGAAGLLLQGCGQQPPPPTPQPPTPPPATPTPLPPPSPSAAALHLPLVNAESGSAPLPTASATASATPAPEAALPSATPRPLATPFAPGPPSKLGLFVGYQHPTMEALLRTGNVAVLKTLELDATLMRFIKTIAPQTTLVARYTPLGQIELGPGSDPRAAARAFVATLLPVATEPQSRAHIDCWEGYNEPVLHTRDEMKRLADFEAERTRLLAAEGIRSCIGNFATGTPPLELWPDFLPAVQAVKETGGFLGLHEYSAPYLWTGSGRYQLQAGQDEGDEGWLTLRYRKVYRDYLQPAGLEVPLLITEAGIDGGIVERPGPPGLGWADFAPFWQAEGMVRSSAEGFYVEQLAWYDAELQADPFVVGAAIFALAAPVGWGSFEIVGGVAALLEQYLAVHPRR